MSELDSLRFPLGRFKPQSDVASTDRMVWINRIASCPEHLSNALDGLGDHQIDTPYRERGWSVRQVVHHLFDSHVNAFIRFRLALTEDNPRVTAYDEHAWSQLPDSLEVDPNVSLKLLHGLHLRWVVMLRAMTEADFGRTLNHPENGPMSLDRMLQLYAWHGGHHVRHITALRERNNW